MIDADSGRLFEEQQDASNQEGSSVYLDAKETWSLESLLYATMLQSGNDAAVAVAEHVAGSEEAFAGLMNDYAREARCLIHMVSKSFRLTRRRTLRICL